MNGFFLGVEGEAGWKGFRCILLVEVIGQLCAPPLACVCGRGRSLTHALRAVCDHRLGTRFGFCATAVQTELWNLTPTHSRYIFKSSLFG